MDDAPDTADAALDALTGELRQALAPEIILLEKIATGGMGSVFLARDVALKRLVVVKVLSPAFAEDERARARFNREAAAAAAVAHPNVVAIHHVGQLPGSPVSYVVMQHIDGLTLAEAFPPGTVVPLGRARRIVGEIADALATAHERGLVHRDIKPANVMVDRESDRAVVLDFGISAVRNDAPVSGATKLTIEGSYLGTPQYMSPEQALGEPVTDRSDVYSLGLVAFELVTGRAAFEEPTPMAMAAAQIHKPAPRVASLRPDLDPSFASLIDRCLVKVPADRPSAAEIAKVLLPSRARTLIEWPPPGLESVHRTGWELTRLAAQLVAGVIGMFALVFFQPTMASGAWSRGETSVFWRILWKPGFIADDIFLRPIECSMRASVGDGCPAALVDAGPIWLFGITLLALIVAGGMLGAFGLAFQLSARLLAGHRAGYPWPVVLDAAWDARSNTAALLNGEGAFALVGQAEREELLLRRRIALVWLVSWTAAATIMPLLWLAGRMVIGDSGALLLTRQELGLVLLPMVLAVAGRIFLLDRERRVLARGRRSARERDAGRLQVPASLVEGWLKTGGLGLAVDTRVHWKRPAVAVAIPLVLAFVAALAALPLLVGVHGSTMWHAATFRGWSRDWMEYMGNSDWQGRWSSLDEDLGRQAERLAPASHDAGRVVPIPGARRDTSYRIGLQSGSLVGDTRNGAADELVRDTTWLWLGHWRSFTDSIAKLPPAQYDAWRRRGNPSSAATKALAASLLAWEAGDRATVRMRLAELMQAGRYMLAVRPTRSWGLRGSVQPALELSARLAREAGDTVAAREAERLWQRIDRYIMAHRLFYFPGFASALMADPATPPGERYVGDSTVSPGVRRELAMGAVGGACLNGRELLFGMSAQRHALLDRVARVTAQLPDLRDEITKFTGEITKVIDVSDGLLGAARRSDGCINRIMRVR